MYYLFHNEVQRGPFTLGQLRSMWSQGILTADILFWGSDSVEWRPLAAMAVELEGSSEAGGTPASPHPLPIQQRRPGAIKVARDGEELGFYTREQMEYRLRTGEFSGLEWCEHGGEWYPIDHVIQATAARYEAAPPPLLVAQEETNVEKALTTYLYTETLLDVLRFFR